MNDTRLISILFLLLGISTACGPSGTSPQETPDQILHNGRILTVDDDFSTAQAVAIKDGRISAVGTDADINPLAGPDTRTVDLGGKTVLPGFNDTHSHFVQMGLNLMATIDLTEAESIEDIQRIVAERVAESEPGEWIFSEGGWWEFMLEDGRLPTRHDLDSVSPENPVALRGGHYFIVNSLALERVGYTRDTPDPPGGEIWRDEEGEPTGFLLRAANTPVQAFFPELDRERQLEGIRRAIRRVNTWGMTSLREAGGTPEQVEMLREIHADGDLTVRVDWAYDVDPNTPPEQFDEVFEALGEPGQTWGDGHFRADGLAELFLDGAEESGQLREAYKGRPDYFGLELVPQEQLNRFFVAAAQYGWRPGPHMVGDAAIDQALEAYEFVNAEIPITDRRWMLDHAILLRPDQYERIKDLNLIVNAQPRHLYIIGDKFIEFWGRERANQIYAFRDWIDNGLMVTLGADRPISPRSTPLMQIQIAVTRKSGTGEILGADQAITRQEAIRAITRLPAYTSYEEGVKGSIEPGHYADFVVLAENILEVPAEKIRDIGIVATILGGELVYGTLE